MAKRKNKFSKFEVKEYYRAGITADAAVAFIKNFMAPFLRSLERSSEQSADKYINLFFHSLTRDIYFVKLLEDIHLPGDKYIAGSRIEKGTGKRFVAKDRILIIREDDTLDYVDVEINHNEEMYRLTKAEHRWLMDKVKVML